ncbi:MAG: STAS domain-containing protein [Treponema sp.]|nr:STAS domain-containing protein [Treponema sp.]
MLIKENRKDHTVELEISGRIDNSAAPVLEEELGKLLSRIIVWTIELDFSEVEYISSAGIRVLLKAQKNITENHELIIKNPSKFCQQVFEVTGSDIFLTIKYN